ncbi:MAG TPA: hypothetical protein VN605_05315, partial [Thermoanaerobaculia bacterium]|nr:hypothetical protein [Thermoanaerobaculia bacterium]
LLVVICSAAALLSAGCFGIQGGFGGGHGDLDWLMFVLGLPWTVIPWPTIMLDHDFFWLVLLPFVFNMAAIATVAAVGKRS